jgi:hypothetical protein
MLPPTRNTAQQMTLYASLSRNLACVHVVMDSAQFTKLGSCPRGVDVMPPKSRCDVHHAWWLLCLTAALIVLTCLEASGSIVTRYLTLINQSRSYSIFLLRALSELAGLALAATLFATLERLSWALLCRNHSDEPGARFADFLALQNGTGAPGLLILALGRSVGAAPTKLLALLRLMVMIFIPLIGILAMGRRL